MALDRQLLSNRAAIPSKLQDQRNGLITGRKGSFEIGILSDGTERSESFVNVKSGPDNAINYKLWIKRDARDSRAMVSSVRWKNLSRIVETVEKRRDTKRYISDAVSEQVRLPRFAGAVYRGTWSGIMDGKRTRIEFCLLPGMKLRASLCLALPRFISRRSNRCLKYLR